MTDRVPERPDAVVAAARSDADGDAAAGSARAGSLDAGQLDELAKIVLPSSLGREARARVVAGFRAWLADYAPGRDLLGTEDTAFFLDLPISRVARSAPRPDARYAAQLTSLDDEARERGGASFAELDRSEQTAIVREVLEAAVDSMPLHDDNPAGGSAVWLAGPAAFVGTDADHVALALMAWYFNGDDAVSEALGAQIAPRTCRGFLDVASPARDGR